MNEIDTALAEQSLFFVVALLVLAAYLQAKIHKESTAVLGKLLDMKNDLREEKSTKCKEMSDMKDDLRKDMSDMKDNLREETKSLGTRLARVEGKF